MINGEHHNKLDSQTINIILPKSEKNLIRRLTGSAFWIKISTGMPSLRYKIFICRRERDRLPDRISLARDFEPKILVKSFCSNFNETRDRKSTRLNSSHVA